MSRRAYAQLVLKVAVLGPLEVTRDGERVPVPRGKTSELVVRLALEAGTPISADRLVDDLWTAGGRSTRRNTLQSKIVMLRKAFGDPSVISSHGGGYALAIEPSDVDAVAALDGVVTASGLLDAGDDRGAADLCASTLNLYRGDPLEDAGDGEWVDAHRVRLEEARTKLMEIHFTARLRLGDVGDVIGELEAAVATYPFQESLWELLITALYRAGRQADALATYQRVRNQLADELGLDPRPQLQELEQRILTQDASLDLASRSAGGVVVAPAPGNLPSMTSELIGRETEVAALADLLADQRLVEVVGPGGVGKTAVAIAVGRRLGLSTEGAADLKGGIWLARLEAATTPNDVVDVLVSAVDGPGSEEALLERLKSTSTLVILDNCEHVLDAAAALAVRLLDAAPGLRILCTSQIPLDVDGEVVFELAPLALPDAVELFTHRATARRVNNTANADDDVLGLCRSLDGLPLAIELAAARTKTLSVEEITRRLEDRFVVLNDPTSRRPERRRSLKSTIRWSYDLLFPDDQRGLWALAAFAGGAPLPAVEFVLEALDVPAAAAIDVVGRLVSRSLVIVDDPGAFPASTDPSGQQTPLGSIPASRQHPGVRARRHDRRRAGRSSQGRTRCLVRRGGRLLHRRRARRSPSRAPVVRSHRAREHRRRADLGRRSRPVARAGHGQRVRVGLGCPRRQQGCATDPEGTRRLLAPLLTRGTGLRHFSSRPGSKPRSVISTWRATTSRSPPTWPTRRATPICRRVAPTTLPTSSPTTASSVERSS